MMGSLNAAVQYIYPMANFELVSAFPVARFAQFHSTDECRRIDFIGADAQN